MRVPCKHGARDFVSFSKCNKSSGSKKIFIFSPRALVTARCAGSSSQGHLYQAKVFKKAPSILFAHLVLGPGAIVFLVKIFKKNRASTVLLRIFSARLFRAGLASAGRRVEFF